MNQGVRHPTSFPNLSLLHRLIHEMQRERVDPPPFATPAKDRPPGKLCIFSALVSAGYFESVSAPKNGIRRWQERNALKRNGHRGSTMKMSTHMTSLILPLAIATASCIDASAEDFSV